MKCRKYNPIIIVNSVVELQCTANRVNASERENLMEIAKQLNVLAEDYSRDMEELGDSFKHLVQARSCLKAAMKKAETGDFDIHLFEAALSLLDQAISEQVNLILNPNVVDIEDEEEEVEFVLFNPFKQSVNEEHES